MDKAMTGKPTIFVSGLGRCGSSMTMQMLDAAGIPCVGDYPAFETWETNAAAISREWLSEHQGYAAKMLDPHRSSVPDDANCVIIWLDRDAGEQARSQCKMISMLGGVDVSGQWRAMRSQIRKDRRKCLKIIDRWPVMMFTFEGILSNPLEISRDIAGCLSPWFDISERVYDMANVVLPRKLASMPDLSIEAALIDRPRPSPEERREMKKRYERVRP
jgi:hypothetical protein